MKQKLDAYLSILFKPLFFVWLASLILFVLFRNHSGLVYWTFIISTIIYGAVIAYATYSLIIAVRDALKDEDE